MTMLFLLLLLVETGMLEEQELAGMFFPSPSRGEASSCSAGLCGAETLGVFHNDDLSLPIYLPDRKVLPSSSK